ncbi:MAG: cupin domain-containing protein [Candidatus Latescibacteria bacterium]|jgi:hypothetical protein|nr:cupin domain-containing protein [Candidatus Latescibacterota bacterium]
MNADGWIKALDLQRHPEGGYYRETYRSEEEIPAAALPGRFQGPRALSTAITFLLPGGEFSALHRIKSDEIWHHYAGSSLTIHVIDPDGTYRRIILGKDIEAGEGPQVVVPAGCWFGATVDEEGSYTLAGCTVSPGFDFEDFELGLRSDLIELYPQHRAIVERLTRP